MTNRILKYFGCQVVPGAAFAVFGPIWSLGPILLVVLLIWFVFIRQISHFGTFSRLFEPRRGRFL